jgi:hypothetical protein
MRQEIIGDDDLEALMAGDDVAIGAVSSSDLRSLARARKADPNAVLVRQRSAANRRRKLLPGSTNPSVAAAASTTVTYKTQETFRPERYVVASAIAADFVITSITVATTNQLAANGSVPADIFAATAFDCDLHFDTAEPGVDIVVGITNISGATAVYYAAFLGTSVS